MSDKALFQLGALEATQLLRKRELSPTDLVQACITRIEQVDGDINAMVTRSFDHAIDRARELENATPVDDPGWLGGLPVAVKDITPVKNMRTTYGSRIYENHIATHSDIIVEHLESMGAIVMGKTNTPEFAAGASTFNDIFGITRNPFDLTKSVSGSSGGSGAALASGQVFLATGSDLGGSLRTPASFNSVMGLRPGPGRVPHGPVNYPFSALFPDGMMARSAEDLALAMDAVCRFNPRDPFSLPAPGVSFVENLRDGAPPTRIAFSEDLGITPVDPVVRRVSRQAAKAFETMGCTVVDAHPDLCDAPDIFQVLRAAQFAADHQGHLQDHRDKLKPEVIWNIEKGLELTAAEIGQAEVARAKLFQRMALFFESYELLICPTAIVPPFDAEVRYIEEVDGVRFDNYIDWISITSAISLTSCPAISVPAGFSDDGLPIGIQIIGPPRSEAAVLKAAARLDEATGISAQLPVDPRQLC